MAKCSVTGSLHNSLANDGLKNGDTLLQAAGSTEHDNQCSRQPRKRGRPRKDTRNMGPVEGSSVSDSACLEQPRKRGRPRKETTTIEVGHSHLPDGSHNLHNQVQIESQHLCLHDSVGTGPAYDDLGDCSERCPYCGAAFWFGERLMSNSFRYRPPQYRLCCGGGRVFMEPETDPPETARDKCAEHDVPEFKVRLYSGDHPRGYELPASQTLGAIVFDSGPESESNYDVILEYRDGVVKRISKIHKSYMSLQFPLIFIYGQPGYHTKLMLRTADPNDEPKRRKTFGQVKGEASTAPLALTEKDSTDEKKD
ncbi:hypothetical protein CTI12_AA067390 [Artemisia annua]|uniref:DNA helicase Pif1-like protein n=1 Tax=Artemisia annua TaxID=35608 RepID=A0A2U1Q6Z4_ARTAN|nr:hypothetical protein CTI12_AA067390 [Artemisia annua]